MDHQAALGRRVVQEAHQAVVGIPTMGEFSREAPVEPCCPFGTEPWNVASPKVKIPPSAATSQYPRPEAVEFARFGREKGVQPRFIEYMPLDADNAWSSAAVVPSAEVDVVMTSPRRWMRR